MRRVLIADDNNFYYDIMETIFKENGYQVTRAVTAKAAWQLIQVHGVEHFNLLVSDITMESQLAGLYLAIKLKKAGFKNPMYFASTGFNFTFNYFLSGGLLKLLGIQRIIPKNAFHALDVNSLQRFFI
ncbi:response regulator [candidate division KSB1 bacterium]|nr:response regulator [candidate division KSB1 bacterium]